MNPHRRENETRGSLDDRVFALEQSLTYRWDRWFDKNPGIVLGVVIVALGTAFWTYHTWKIGRIDNKHQQELSRIIEENESKMNWLKEQQDSNLEIQANKCGMEKEHISKNLEACVNASKLYPTKHSEKDTQKTE